jgi:hypothetical protein
LTVIDEDDDDTFVNVAINIQEGFVATWHTDLDSWLTRTRNIEAGKKPIEATFTETPQIPRQPKKAPPAETNGNGIQNGEGADDDIIVAEPKGIKRPHPEDSDQPLKKAKMNNSEGNVVIVEDAGGAIIIDWWRKSMVDDIASLDRCIQAALNPPSRLRTQLLAKAFEARKTAAFATSSGAPTRFRGVSLRNAACKSGLRSKTAHVH